MDAPERTRFVIPVVVTYRRCGSGIFGVVLDERTFVVLAACPVLPLGRVEHAMRDALAVLDSHPEWRVVRS